MKTIDLKKIIEDRKLDKKEVAQQLFPDNLYPVLALNRILTGEAVLDANQISKLSLLAAVPISALYGAEWRGKKAGHVYTFTHDKFKAELNDETWTTKVFDSNSLFHESIIHNGTMALSDYLTKLNEIIINHQLKTQKQQNESKI